MAELSLLSLGFTSVEKKNGKEKQKETKQNRNLDMTVKLFITKKTSNVPTRCSPPPPPPPPPPPQPSCPEKRKGGGYWLGVQGKLLRCCLLLITLQAADLLEICCEFVTYNCCNIAKFSQWLKRSSRTIFFNRFSPECSR